MIPIAPIASPAIENPSPLNFLLGPVLANPIAPNTIAGIPKNPVKNATHPQQSATILDQ